MVSLTGVDSTVFLLPEDGDVAKTTFLELLHNNGETWISFYGFTDPDLIRQIEVADANGVKGHILLDRSQSQGHTEHPEIVALAGKLLNGDITITTAGAGSHSTGQIWHDKMMTVRSVDGGEDHVWWGSVNASGGFKDQGNIANVLRSNVLAAALIQRHAIHSAWGRTHEPQSQIWPVTLPASTTTDAPTVTVEATSTETTVTVETEANATTVSTDAPASVTVTSP